jgi:hypothetical protein
MDSTWHGSALLATGLECDEWETFTSLELSDEHPSVANVGVHDRSRQCVLDIRSGPAARCIRRGRSPPAMMPVASSFPVPEMNPTALAEVHAAVEAGSPVRRMHWPFAIPGTRRGI